MEVLPMKKLGILAFALFTSILGFANEEADNDNDASDVTQGECCDSCDSNGSGETSSNDESPSDERATQLSSVR